MVRAGKFKSPTVSNTNELPAEQPFIASAAKIQSVVRGFAARKRVAKVLEKQRKNREKKQIRQQNKKKKVILVQKTPECASRNARARGTLGGSPSLPALPWCWPECPCGSDHWPVMPRVRPSARSSSLIHCRSLVGCRLCEQRQQWFADGTRVRCLRGGYSGVVAQESPSGTHSYPTESIAATQFRPGGPPT
jgi:hypothetical protein